jgi:mannose-6-phosphate isomerase-like protein (cupin superfamily)
MERLTIANALSALQQHATIYHVLFRHGTLEVGFYRPGGPDRQRPHDRDEVYVVASGTATFLLDGTRQPLETGETVFAAAGAEHRFEDMSADFSTWVFFYGPQGGEPA